MSRLYRTLLRWYPASFRREYGEEMERLFARRLAGTAAGSAKLALWFEAMRDIAANGAAAHWDLLRQDLRQSGRTIIRSPGFALTAILVTALGVGATTAAFSVADFVLFRPLPFRNPEQLVRVWQSQPGYEQMEFSPPNYHDIKASSRSFETLAAFHPVTANLTGEGAPRRVDGATVTRDLLPMLGVSAAVGRIFTPADGADGVVLSYGLWQNAFGAGDVIGHQVSLNGQPRVVLGVMPAGFHFPSREAQFWLPMPDDELADTSRTNNWFLGVGRLRPGISVAQAQAEVSALAAGLAQRFPIDDARIGATLYRMQDGLSEQSRLLLLGLGGASLCVLLIACANLANLLLARGLMRHRELVVRTALGAGRERLVRQLITESLCLALLGGLAGVSVAAVTVPLLTRLVPMTLPIAAVPSVDLRILGFAALLTGITGIAFGVFPALQASRNSSFDALREGGRSGGGRRARFRAALVIAEVTASVVLLVGAGLLLRALWRIQATDPGFRAENVLTLTTAIPSPKYDLVVRREQFYHQVLDQVRAAPGVRSAAYISGVPMAMRGGIWPVTISGRTLAPGDAESASLRYTTPDFFKTLDIPIRRGRDVLESDRQDQPWVAVVSESFANRYWPGEDPIGKRFQFAFGERTIVGIVGDVRVRGLERVSEPQVYLPYQQVQDTAVVGYFPKSLVIATSGPSEGLMAVIRAAVSRADPDQPIADIRMLDEIVSDGTASRTVQARVLAIFALVAFLLASVGIHGLLSYSVSNRRHEIAVRAALGANPSRVVGMVLAQGAAMALAGIIPGILVALAAGRMLESLLAGVRPADPVTFGAAVMLCLVMTLAGSLVPVVRAVRIAPATALRAE